MASRFSTNMPKTEREKLAAMIRRVRLFSNFTPLDMENIGNYLSLRKVSAGETIFKEGDNDMEMYFVAKGRVNVVKESPDSSTSITTIIEGQSMGEMSMLDTMPYSATVMAETDCCLLVLGRDRYDSLLKNYPKLGNKLLSQLARLMSVRLRLTTGMLVSISSKNASL